MKRILNSTSVWSSYVELDQRNLTSRGYFDLSKLSGLYVHGTRKLFKFYREKAGLSQKDCAELLGLSNVTNYEYLNKSIPFKFLKFLADLCNEDIFETLNALRPKFSTGNGKEIPIYLPISPKSAENYITNLIPSKCPTRYIVYVKRKLPNGVSHLNTHLSRHGTKFVYSKLLWKFLNTFYKYERELKLNIPLCNLSSAFKASGISSKVIVGTLLLTEGSRNKKGFDFSNKSVVLHNLLIDAVYDKYNLIPTTYLRKGTRAFRTYYYSGNSVSVREDLEKTFGCLKTKPTDIRNYLSLPQPTLEKVKKKQDKKMVIRLFSVTEGNVWMSVRPYNRKKKEYIVCPTIGFACTHPKLLLDLNNILVSLGFVPSLGKGKTWSGWARANLAAFHNIIKFLRIGGFIPGVKVARSDAILHGFEKRAVLLAILELRKRMLKDSSLRKLNRYQLYSLISKILKQGSLKNEEHYIKCLKTNHHAPRKSRCKLEEELRRNVKLMLEKPMEFIKSLNLKDENKYGLGT